MAELAVTNIQTVTPGGGVAGTTPYVDDAQALGVVKVYSARALSVGILSAWGQWVPMTAAAGIMPNPGAFIVGPRTWVVPSGVLINPGTSIQSVVDANPAGTVYILGAGTHVQQSVLAKNGDTFVGQPGCIMDGQDTTLYAFTRSGGNPDNLTIRGIRMTKYVGSSAMGPINAGNFPADNTDGWLLEDFEVDHSHNLGVRLGHNMTVRRGYIHHCATLGIGGAGDNVLVEYCEISYNNDGTSNPDSGGTKFVLGNNLMCRFNWAHHNNGPGFWGDIANRTMHFFSNLSTDNFQEGFVVEISHDFTIDYNVSRRNGLLDTVRGDAWGWSAGIGIHASGGSSGHVHHNYCDDNRHGITVLQQHRGTSYGDPAGVGSNTVDAVMLAQNLSIHDNVIIQPTNYGVSLPPTTGAMADPADPAMFTSRNIHFENNHYYITSALGAPPFSWSGPYKTFATWNGYGNDDSGDSSFSTDLSTAPPVPDLSGGGDDGGGSVGCEPPSASGRPSQVASIGTLVLQEVDPQNRIFTRNFRHRTGSGGPWSAWAAATNTPPTDTVTLDAEGGVVEWSVCYIACDGTMQQLTGSATFDPAGTEETPPSAGQRTTDVATFYAGGDLIRVQAPPAALTEIDPDWREWKDATAAVRVRASGRVYAPGNAGLEVVFQYSLDGGTSWAPLGIDESNQPLDASYVADGTADDPDDPKGDFVTLAGAARTDILCSPFTRGGDADIATILKLGNQKLEFEQLGAGEPDPAPPGDPQSPPDDDPTDPVDPCIPGQFVAANYTAEADVQADGWVKTLNTSALAISGAGIVLDPDDGLPTFKLEYQATTPFVTGGGQLTYAKEFTGLDPTKNYSAIATFKGVQVSFALQVILDIEGNGNSHTMTLGEKDGTYQSIQTQIVACQPDGKLVVTFGLGLIQNGDQAHHEIDYFRQIDLVEDGC